MDKSLPLSAIVLTHDEEKNIGACLESLSPWADEIFVVDSGSTDATTIIAAHHTTNIIYHPFENYSRQRNWAQQNLPLKNDWVLHVDADERVTAELAASLQHFFDSDDCLHFSGALMSRRTVFLGRWIRHGGHYPVYHLRLFRRDRGRCEDRLYDQHFLVDGPTARLAGDLIDVLAPDLDTWSLKHIRWATAEARELRRHRSGDQVVARLGTDPISLRRWLRTQLFGNAPPFLRAFLYFTYRYLVRRGFLDGVEGLIFHVLHGFWYRFYIDAKTFELDRLAPVAGRDDSGSQVVNGSS